MRILARLLALAAFCVGASHADDGLFKLDTNVAGVQTSASYASVEAAFDALKNSNLGAINPAYTGTQAVNVQIDYRGVAVTASYGMAGSSALSLSIPSIGLSKTFDGGSRDATQQLLKNYFKQDTDDVLGRLSKGLARMSPVDPIAGNPNSLMSQLVAADFDQGFVTPATTATSGPASNLGSLGGGYGQFRDGGVTSRTYAVPLGFTIRSDDDPRRQLSVRVPIAMTDANGSRSYDIGIGASLGLPVNDRWTLTPALDYAAAGSRDLGSLAGMASASLTSSYVVPFSTFDIALGDLVGYYKALRVKSGDYGYDPNIANTVVRNGVLLSHAIAVGARQMLLAYSLIDTQFFGDALYARHYDEVGVSLASDTRTSTPKSDVRAGASFVFSPKAKGLNVGVRVRF